MRGKRDWVASSTVSLKASEGEWPFSRRTWYWARNIPSTIVYLVNIWIRAEVSQLKLTDTAHQL